MRLSSSSVSLGPDSSSSSSATAVTSREKKGNENVVECHVPLLIKRAVLFVGK